MNSNKNKFYVLCWALMVFILVSSCTMQKRKYVKGYYIDRIAKHENDIVTKQTLPKGEDGVSNVETKTWQASADNSIQLPIGIENSFSEESAIEKCDTIILNNGVKMLVKVISEGEVNIIYKTCEGTSDELKTIDRAKVRRVGYGNGGMKNPNDDKYIDPYQNATKPSKSYNDYKNDEAERGDRQLDNALVWLAICILFSPGLIVGLILAALARKKLKGKPGYEQRYRLANTLTIIGAVLLGFLLVFIAFYLFLLFGI